jgi:hypothetical protein
LTSPGWRELLLAFSARSASSAISALCAVSFIANVVYQPEIAAVTIVAEVCFCCVPDWLAADGAVEEHLRAELAWLEYGEELAA